MRLAQLLVLLSGIIYSLITGYLILVYLRLTTLYQGANVRHPSLFQNWFFLTYLLSAILSYLILYIFKKKSDQGLKVRYSLIISIALLTIPFIISSLYFLLNYWALRNY